MIGQEFRNARRVIMLAELEDGTQIGYEVFNPTQIGWVHTGVIAGSSHGRMEVTGEFHRMSKDVRSRQIEDQMQRAIGGHDGRTAHRLPKPR